MNREHWKAMLPIITAFVEGKTIQKKTSVGVGGWADHQPDFVFDCQPEHYRIKPEPKLRPWKPEEVPVGAVVRGKTTRTRCLIVGVNGSGTVDLGAYSASFDREYLLENYELLDGSPCGVSEVSE